MRIMAKRSRPALRLFACLLGAATAAFAGGSQLRSAHAEPIGPSKGQAEEANASEIEATITDGLLTLNVRDAPLADVLRAIGAAAGFAVVIEGDATAAVSRSFVDVKLEAALLRLAGNSSMVLVLDPGGAAPDGGTGTLWLLRPGAVDDHGRMVGPLSGDGPPLPHDPYPVPPWLAGHRSTMPPVYVSYFKLPIPKVRRAAIGKLAREEGNGAVALIADVLTNDDDASVREEAAHWLGRLGGGAAVLALGGGLGDPAASVRAQVVSALARAGGEQAVEALSNIVADDSSAEVRRTAIHALSSIGGETARDGVREGLSDSDRTVIAAATNALASWPRR